jgi:hypothetical protein
VSFGANDTPPGTRPRRPARPFRPCSNASRRRQLRVLTVNRAEAGLGIASDHNGSEYVWVLPRVRDLPVNWAFLAIGVCQVQPSLGAFAKQSPCEINLANALP